MRSNRLLGLLGLVALVCACGGRQVTGESSPADNMTATSGSGGTFSGAGGAQSSGTGGPLGSGGASTTTAEPPHRCSFGPATAAPVGAAAPVAEIIARVERFILGQERPPSSVPPSGVAPGDLAMELLDGFAGASSGAPGGFIRWLAKWSYDGKAPSSAPQWANIMAGSSATLSSLIAPPGAGPQGGGYLIDKEILLGRSSIDRRGMMGMGQLFCQVVPPAPPGAMIMTPLPMPGVTERELHAQSISNPACAACHHILDPFGHAFGHFDRTGAYRDLDNGLPVDSSDQFVTPQGTMLNFSSIADLAPQLAQSCEVARCISQSLMREAVDTDPAVNVERVTDDDVVPVANAFADSGFSIRALVRSIVESPAFLR
jgi:Protein of unknown function (DUF1588)